jgi:EAL domain-containing protein (putative c-di-GMP-specific phosphodiesterase class I)
MLENNWYLEGYFNAGILSRLPVNHFPFQIGRQSGIGFTVPSGSVSRIHAEIIKDGDRLILRDNNSTNGTFINRNRLQGQVELQHGDVIHFADFEVRLIKETVKLPGEKTNSSMTVVGMAALSDKMPTGVRELQELLDKKMIIAAFQPIIHTGTEVIHAYEVLGRGTHPSLSRSPGPLFHIAESLSGLALNLSRLFRDVGVSTAATFDTDAKFFVNIHPEELTDLNQLLKQMENLRKDYPKLGLVLEIHEKAASNLDDMKKIRRELDKMNVELAYDDFGAGQARLMELVEAPAHYLKFDINLVRGIDKAPDTKKDMVQMLVSMAKKMGISTLAEGIEREEEVIVCREMGFDYIQGYYYGKPKEGSL